MTKIIENILHSLGITRNYCGYHQTVTAVKLAIEDEFRLLSVTKSIYLPVAYENNCNPLSVERNIRTVILLAWRTNRDVLNNIAGFHLSAPPTVSQFIDIIASYIQRTYIHSNIF